MSDVHMIRRLSFNGQTAVSSLCRDEDSYQTAYVGQHREPTQQRDDDDSANDPYAVAEYIGVDDTSVARKMSDAMATSIAESASSRTTSTATKIALFGGHGKTGKHFLRLALDAGYHVRALVPPSNSHHHNRMSTRTLSELADHTALRKTHGTLQESQKVQKVLKGAQLVVCLLNDTLPSKGKDYPKDCLANFMRLLYALMKKEGSIKVFLYQATSLAPDVAGGMPILAKVLRTVAKFSNPFLADQEAALQHVAMQHHGQCLRKDEHDDSSDPRFSYIVIRPSILVRDGPSMRRLSASRSQPGPMPVTHIDLAEFALNALRNKKLFNTSPYVVADSF